MSSYLLSAYVLVWPVMAAGVLLVLSRGVWQDILDAKKDGESPV